MADGGGAVVGQRVRELRRRVDMTQEQLAARLAECGAPMDRVTVAKIETGARGVSVDDLLVLGLALDVSPIALLLPGDGDELPVGSDSFTSGDLLAWLRGALPLRPLTDSRAESSYLDALPDVRAARELGHWAIVELWQRADQALTFASCDERRLLLLTLEEMADDVATILRRLRREDTASGAR